MKTPLIKTPEIAAGVSASVFLLFSCGVNAGLLGGSVSGCLGLEVTNRCVTEPGTWSGDPPSTIMDPGVEFSNISETNNGPIRTYADFTDTSLTLTIDGTDVTNPGPGIGRAPLRWRFSNIALIPPDSVISKIFLASQGPQGAGARSLYVTSLSYDSDSILITTKGFYYAEFAGRVLSATLDIVTSDAGAEPSIEISGGEIQECVTEGGNLVTFSYVKNVDVASIEWLLDDVSVGFELAVDAFVTLGEHSITANVTTAQGDSLTESATVEIVDTAPPEVTAAFLDARTGQVINQASNGMRLLPSISLADICDSAPSADASVGARSENGETLIANKTGTGLVINTESMAGELVLSVTAVDASGNEKTEKTVVEVMPR